MYVTCRFLNILKKPRRLVRNIDSIFCGDRIHRGHNQIIPENNFSADYTVPQVHMKINFASETCHRIAFLIASDSSTCTQYSDDINVVDVTRVYAMLMRATQQHVFLDNSADVPPQPEAEHDEAPSKTVRADGLWALFILPSPSCC